ncbi:TetR/AcrR family transcriptional regulator [Amycolatopsis sp. RTGN1]|uniref:TetR/AcrR family transcriptional regulator n=1 Tax=Amycolatopsis ponsaeliensis TaxID=2992142 RepID=UPI00254A73CA|nr:TetR/AcrR family transcriptional regulator [Amycolatopsis sp. RTGN1]
MTAPRRARNPRGEGGRLREQIVSAAIDLLDDGGGERAVTLRAVARRIGIAPPSIYAHFPDRPALLLAVARRGFADLAGRLRSTAAAVEEPRQRLHAVCRTYLEYARHHPQRYHALFGDHWSTQGAEAMRILTDSLTACTASGDALSEDPATDAIVLWLGLHGLAHQRIVASSYPWPTDITRRLTVPLAHLVEN